VIQVCGEGEHFRVAGGFSALQGILAGFSTDVLKLALLGGFVARGWGCGCQALFLLGVALQPRATQKNGLARSKWLYFWDLFKGRNGGVPIAY